MPERMCIVTREVRMRRSSMRFVRSPDGDVVPDLARKLPGRGVWVSAGNRDTRLAEAIAKGLFSRGFKAPEQGRLPENLPDLVGKACSGGR
jgi:predicted RNA-binding protein YlxR (DUF448 family)